MLSLVDPTPAEAQALASPDTNTMGLLIRLKSLAKQLHQRPDAGMPMTFAQLLYTLAIVVAQVRHGQKIHTITPKELAQNIRWFLKQSWFDDRLVAIFQAALSQLEPA
jgi:hypothetical protein